MPCLLPRQQAAPDRRRIFESGTVALECLAGMAGSRITLSTMLPCSCGLYTERPGLTCRMLWARWGG